MGSPITIDLSKRTEKPCSPDCRHPMCVAIRKRLQAIEVAELEEQIDGYNDGGMITGRGNEALEKLIEMAKR